MPAYTQFDSVTLSEGVREIGNAQKPFLSRYFPFNRSLNMHASNLIAFGILKRNPRVSVFRKSKEGAAIVAHDIGDEKQVLVPKIRLKKVIDEDYARAIDPSMPSYMGSATSLENQLSEKILDDQQDLMDIVRNTMELMMAQALFLGSTTLTFEDASTATISFGYSSGTNNDDTIQDALTGTDLWTDDLANPRGTLDALRAKIERTSNARGPFDVLMSYDICDAFLRNAEVRAVIKTDSGFRGTGNPDLAFDAKFVGNIFGYNIYRYEMNYELASTLTAMSPNNKILMVPTPGSTRNWAELHHAAVWDRPAPGARAQFILTDYFSKINGEGDPPVDEIIVETDPLPLIKNVLPIKVQQVIT